MLDMLRGVFREDNDVVQQPDANDIQVFFQDIVHEVLKACRGISGTLGADEVLIVPLPTSESSLPLIPLPDPHLVVYVAEVNFGEDLGKVKSIQHFRYAGEWEEVFNRDFVESPVVDYQAKLPIRTWNGGL